MLAYLIIILSTRNLKILEDQNSKFINKKLREGVKILNAPNSEWL